MHRSILCIGVISCCFACATTASAVMITSGTYTGSSGATTSTGGTAGSGGDAMDFNDGAADNSISGGTFTGGSGGSSSGGVGHVNEGGTGGNGVSVSISGTTLDITGGDFLGGPGGNASGGLFSLGGAGGDAVYATNSGAVTVSGGSFTQGTGGTPSAGGNGFVFSAFDSGVITLIGTFQDPPASPITNSAGTLTGELAGNNSVQSYSYIASSGGSIILVPAPEPATLTLLIAATLGLLAKRRHPARRD